MTLSAVLLRAPRVGAREFRNRACSFIRKGKAYLVTEHGQPAGVFLPYEDAIELAEIIDELNDRELLKTIAEGRRAIRKGAKGILLTDSLKKKGCSVQG
jgi:PHD/YefM family antitoxin component YafN of YafNO toxin-antitoxin module